jgi:predicted MFS family arabinose efflux permease
VFGNLLAGVACLVIFVLVEAHASSPMLPLELFKSRPFSGANLITLFLYAAVGIFFFLFPMNLIQLHGYSTTATGAAVLPMILLMFLLSRWSGGLVSRHGARIPLIVGPLIASSGFLIFALLPAKGSYWATFFPATLVLGLGMAVTVAPLTTVVMSSVDQDHVGTASGINNAVARVAGVLAIAALGIVMVKVFASQLDQNLAGLSISPDIAQHIRTKQIELAGMELPQGLDARTVETLRRAITTAFLSSFRLIMFLCAALSAASAIVAWRWSTANTNVYHSTPPR